MSNNVKYLLESKFLINFTLYCLALLSVFSGYFFFNIFISPGSRTVNYLTCVPLFSNNDIFIDVLP